MRIVGPWRNSWFGIDSWNGTSFIEGTRKMDTTNATNTTSPVRGVMTYVMGSIAVLTCPCHLPILLLLLSGTAAGAFLSQNLGIAFLLLLPVFLLSGFATWRLLDRSDGNTR